MPFSSYCSVYKTLGSDKEILSNNQKLLYLVIISFILVTFMFDPGAIL